MSTSVDGVVGEGVGCPRRRVPGGSRPCCAGRIMMYGFSSCTTGSMLISSDSICTVETLKVRDSERVRELDK